MDIDTKVLLRIVMNDEDMRIIWKPMRAYIIKRYTPWMSNRAISEALGVAVSTVAKARTLHNAVRRGNPWCSDFPKVPPLSALRYALARVRRLNSTCEILRESMSDGNEEDILLLNTIDTIYELRERL